MKINNKNNPVCISIIGPRAYPPEFVGTSGLEFYVYHALNELLNKNKNSNFLIYVKNIYQEKPYRSDRINTIGVFTIRSKVFEALVYSFISSILSTFDKSKTVWYHGIGPAIFSFLPKAAGKKIVVTIHSLDWQRTKWSPLESFIFSRFIYFIKLTKPKFQAVSSDICKYLFEKYQIKSSYAPPKIKPVIKFKKTDILNGLKLKPKKYLYYIGRFVPEKRLEWLLDAFMEIKNQNPWLKLVLSGGHGNMPEYEAKLKNKYKDPNIIWTGYVFGDNKYTLLSNCVVFALPSGLEGNSISLIEARASGSVCVVSDIYIPPEIKIDQKILGFINHSYSDFLKTLVRAISLFKSNKCRNAM